MTTSNSALVTSMLAFSLLLVSLFPLIQGQAVSTPYTSSNVLYSKHHFQPTRLQSSILRRELSHKRSTLDHTFQLGKELHHPFVNRLDGSVVAVNATIAPSEVNALLAIRESIHVDPFGALANWSAKANSSYCTSWMGVSCDDMGHVISIELTDLMLNGTLNPTIGNLMHLSYLNLSGNSLYGDLPLDLMRCKSLVVVDLSVNYLDGKLLAGHLYKLPKLEYIDFSNNKFSGLLPEVPQNSCVSLTNLMIAFTNLYGAIPSSLDRCKDLRVLVLYSNQLSGNIPISLGKLYKLVKLVLGINGLTGHIPSQLTSLKNLQILGLDLNNLQGPIPTSLGDMTSLVQLNLEWNQLTGHIPSELASLKNLQFLYLNSNNLQGPIPPLLGGMTSLVELWFDGNQLSGHIPSELASLKNLQILGLGSNNLKGPIPTQLGGMTSLVELGLSNNHLSGHIPSELGSLKQLQLLTLQQNNLSGPIPPSLQNCSFLQYLILSDNNLSGTLPSGFEDVTVFWPSLYVFSISNNKLEGNLPLSLASLNSTVAFMDFSMNNFIGTLSTEVDGSHLSSLRVLLVSYNQLEGPIPSWIGGLRSLQVLDVSHNKLTGSIPQNFGNLDGYKVQSGNVSWNPLGSWNPSGTGFIDMVLTPKGQDISEDYAYIWLETTYMDMSSNALEGEIPTGITDLVGMKYLLLSNNKLEGGISPAFQYMEQLETLDLSQNNLSGVIPTSLPFALSTFNVSYNNLNGAIPIGNQFNTFDMSSYIPRNPGLCGDVIKRPCVVDNVPPIGDSTESNEYQIFDYGSLPPFAIGLVSGFFVVVAISLTWAPAFDFVFGGEVRRREEEKRYVASMLRPQQYGLFKYPT
ncbi:hypothetical protein KC19_9G032200 [Ceratodon purpureus]|uniref:Leucine-rich repeat-containing N-terminal plant-type domain-containing protein n=1 Tax=Ceratodon purpureus TaxID=3225 RepID=A0A8T0GPT6_CERPU|nr:hypothetical protein KC19_9G032200 [Ceratodon purpureus]